MFKSIRDAIQGLKGGAKQEEAYQADDHRVAAAALAFHAIAVDGVVDDNEKAKLRDVLKQRFELDDQETEALIEEACRRDMEAVDLYGFTSVLKRNLDAEGRLHVVDMLWQIVYADGQVHEFEDNLVWRVAELLGVSARDRVLLRKQVQGREGDD